MRLCYDYAVGDDKAIVSVLSPPKKRGPGRPPVFTKPVRQKFLDRMALGDRPTIAARNAGVSWKTAKKYIDSHPKFARKMARAEQPAIEIVEDRMFALTQTSVPAGIFWLSNRAPDRWKRDADKAVLAQVNVGGGQSVEWTMQDARARLHQMADELEEKRQQKAEQAAIEAESREVDDGG